MNGAFRKGIQWILLLCIGVCCAVACDNESRGRDDEPRLPENPTESPSYPSSAVKVVTQSLAQDTTVVAGDVTSVTLTYSSEITIARPEHITLNDRTATGASATGNTLTIPLTLEPATTYTLIVSGDALSAGEGKSAVSFTLNFATRATVNLNRVATSLCNDNPTAEAQELYNRFLSAYGEKTFSGVTENNIDENEFSQVIHSVTGKLPAITCYDFKDIHTANYSTMQAALNHYSAGGIVAFSWQWLVPSDESSSSDEYSADNDFSISNALRRGRWENDFIENDLDIVAAHLQRLKDAGIPVLFDPIRAVQNHWWGKKGGTYFRELWKLIYDRLVVEHGLYNLIWVWTTECENLTAEELKEWYPGDTYCDIIGTPIYADGIDSQIERFLLLNETFEGKKMIAITECGNIPDIEACHTIGDTWLYFTVNGDSTRYNFYNHNTESHWKHVMNTTHVITL